MSLQEEEEGCLVQAKGKKKETEDAELLLLSKEERGRSPGKSLQRLEGGRILPSASGGSGLPGTHSPSETASELLISEPGRE